MQVKNALVADKSVKWLGKVFVLINLLSVLAKVFSLLSFLEKLYPSVFVSAGCRSSIVYYRLDLNSFSVINLRAINSCTFSSSDSSTQIVFVISVGSRNIEVVCERSDKMASHLIDAVSIVSQLICR